MCACVCVCLVTPEFSLSGGDGEVQEEKEKKKELFCQHAAIVRVLGPEKTHNEDEGRPQPVILTTTPFLL